MLQWMAAFHAACVWVHMCEQEVKPCFFLPDAKTFKPHVSLSLSMVLKQSNPVLAFAVSLRGPEAVKPALSLSLCPFSLILLFFYKDLD